MKRNLLMGMFSLATALLVSACDNGQDVYLHNATNETVFAYERMDDQTTQPYRIEPGQTFKNAWIVPPPDERARSTTHRRVEARLQDGSIVFCAVYTYPELDRMGWRIDIERRNAC